MPYATQSGTRRGLGNLTRKPTLDDIAMGRVAGLVGRVNVPGGGAYVLQWTDALPESSGLPPVWLAWSGAGALDVELQAQVLRDGYTIVTATCEGSPPLGAIRAGRADVEFSLDARTAFLVGQRCPGSFMPRQRAAFNSGGMPLARPAGVVDALWDMLVNPGRWPGFIPAASIVTPPTGAADPWAAACDFMVHNDAIQRYRAGQLTRAGLLAVYRACLDAGGTPRSDIWNEREIPGFVGGPNARIGQTGDGTITFPGLPPVDAPSGGTTRLPPRDDDDDDDDGCPEGWIAGDGPGVCIRYSCNPGYVLLDGVCVPDDDPAGPGGPDGPDDPDDRPRQAGGGMVLLLALAGAVLASRGSL